MPTRPPTPCRHPGCAALVYGGGGYCPSHLSDRAASARVYDQTTRKNDPVVAFSTRIHGSARWQKIRSLFRSANPCCCDPFKEHGEFPPLMSQVHHIAPLSKIFESEDHEQAYAWENLASVCSGCHSKLSAMERAGKETAHLFKDRLSNELNIGFA
jgi:5-methylcytosine-specific restriction protein A